MIVNAGYRGKVGAGAPKFTYTGTYNIRKDGVVELLTSGTIVFLEPKVIDVFMVGGGGGGNRVRNSGPGVANSGKGGGGGGYTRTIRRVAVTANASFPITIGAGGNGGTSSAGSAGGATAFNNFQVDGGGHIGGYSDATYIGAPGGSGGGGGVASNSDYGTGGSDGNNGEVGYPSSYNGGSGQNFTTREFGEATGKLYAGGGGGGRYLISNTPIVSMGGPGGGGAGGWKTGGSDGNYQSPSAGGANTGGGGGGGVFYSGSGYYGTVDAASGGSGIVCFRDAQELPELAGTWVLNEKMYMADITASIFLKGNIVMKTISGGTIRTTKALALMVTGEPSFNYLEPGSTNAYDTIYLFNRTSPWYDNTRQLEISNITQYDATFHAWLASNATKQ